MALAEVRAEAGRMMGRMETLRLTPAVQAALASAQCDGNGLVLTAQLDRKLYVQVNKALEMLGGKWNRKARAHLFEDAAADVVADAIATGTALDLRRYFQFFETPSPVVELLLDYADVRTGQRVLEPSAGRGAIVRGIRERGAKVLACELWPKNREHLVEQGWLVICDDFMSLRTGGDGHVAPFERIVANPPFARGQDVDHVERMLQHLAPGGRLASVMSPGWRFRQDKKHQAFRSRMAELGAEWHELPAGSFEVSGTGVNAGIVVIQA